jgi:lysophospholipase L1-like esterase
LPAQVEQLGALERTPDTILVSVGANDIGFSKIVTGCGKRPHTQSCFAGSLGRKISSLLDALPDRYRELSDRLKKDASRVFLTEYFDPTGDVHGAACESILKPSIRGLGSFGLNKEDVEDARTKLLDRLNKTLHEAVDAHGWKEITGIAQAFRGHGYCAEKAQRWIRTLGESFLQQGTPLDFKARVAGTLHPNREGHQQIARLIETELLRSAAPSCAARQRLSAPPAADPPDPPPAQAEPICLSPEPVNLVMSSTVGGAGVSAPAWTLIGVGLAGLLLLVPLAGVGPARARKVAPALMTATIGGSFVALGAELESHTALAVTLITAGGLVLVASVAMLWRHVRRGPLAPIPRFRARLAPGSVRLGPLMGAKSWSTVDLIVVCLGVALVVFFAGATAAVAAGETPPTALWAAGSAVSGGLLGLLVPSPGSKRAHEAAAVTAQTAADKATAEADAHLATARAVVAPADAADPKAKAEAAEATAKQSRAEAAAHNATAAGISETKLAATLLFAVFVLSLALGVVLAAGTFTPAHPFVDSLKSVTTAVIALASASGSALIGILAPTSSKG